MELKPVRYRIDLGTSQVFRGSPGLVVAMDRANPIIPASVHPKNSKRSGAITPPAVTKSASDGSASPAPFPPRTPSIPVANILVVAAIRAIPMRFPGMTSSLGDPCTKACVAYEYTYAKIVASVHR
jgi:hypothetical protein